MGAWKHKGSPKRFFLVERNTDNEILTISPLTEKCNKQKEDVYVLKRSYSENASDSTVRKIVATLTG